VYFCVQHLGFQIPKSYIRVNFSKDLLIKQELVKTYWAFIIACMSWIDWLRALNCWAISSAAMTDVGLCSSSAAGNYGFDWLWEGRGRYGKFVLQTRRPNVTPRYVISTTTTTTTNSTLHHRASCRALPIELYSCIWVSREARGAF